MWKVSAEHCGQWVVCWPYFSLIRGTLTKRREGGGPPFGVTREELDSLFGPHFELVEELKPRTAYPGREGREIIRLLRKRGS